MADPESFSEVGHWQFQTEALTIPRRVDVQHYGEGARRWYANWCRRLWGEDRALVDATEETFHFTKIVVWNANARGKTLQDLMQRNSSKVASKVAAQDTDMQENPAWFGAMGVVSDSEYGEMSALMQSTLRSLAMPGARAWLVTVTDGARRSNPTGVPSVGVGCVLVPLSDALFVHGCSMGIAMANNDSYLSTEQGDRHFKDQTCLVRVPKDGRLFVSPGSCYCVVYWSKDKACKEKFKKETNVAPCAHCLHIPLAVDSWKAHVGEAQLLREGQYRFTPTTFEG